MPSTASTELPVSIDVAHDRLSVRLIVNPQRAVKALDAPAIVSHLKKMGLTIGRRGEAEIQEFCRPRKPGRTAPPVVVAMGTAAVDDVPAHLTLIQPAGGSVFEAPHVKAGDAVATLVPRRSGRDGVDVFGKPIARQQAPEEPCVDSSLSPSVDGRVYHAVIDGVVRVRGEGRGKTIAVLPCLRNAGDVTGTSLHSPGEISVQGNVSAATLRAGSAIHISGDMDNSTAACDGQLTAGALCGATIDVAGDCIASEVFQSRIACGGELKVENGSVVGGQLIAAGGLRCKSLGSPAFVKTMVEIGIDDRFRQRLNGILPEIEGKIAKACRIRQTVEPLLRSPQPLTPQQQLRVAALLAEADALDELAQSQRSQFRQEFDSVIARCRYEIAIAQIVYPGVTIRFPGAQTMVRIALKGPCRITLEANGTQPRIMLHQNGSNPIPLELSKLNDDWRVAVKQLAA